MLLVGACGQSYLKHVALLELSQHHWQGQQTCAASEGADNSWNCSLTKGTTILNKVMGIVKFHCKLPFVNMILLYICWCHICLLTIIRKEHGSHQTVHVIICLQSCYFVRGNGPKNAPPIYNLVLCCNRKLLSLKRYNSGINNLHYTADSACDYPPSILVCLIDVHSIWWLCPLSSNKCCQILDILITPLQSGWIVFEGDLS